MTGSLIRLNDISKRYVSGDRVVYAVCGVSLSIDAGAFATVTGASGSGKSTLLSLIGLLEKADGGALELAGVDVARLGFDQMAVVRNKNIGFIFQSFNLIGDLDALDNVALPLRYGRRTRRSEARKMAAQALQRVGLSERATHYPSQLSGGQQQRVAIARALVGSPALLLADEPTGNLDSHSARDVIDLLRELHAEGATVLLVTHNAQQAQIGTVRFHMSDGRLTLPEE